MKLFGPPDIDGLKHKRRIPRLLKALQYPHDASIRAAAARALGEIDAQQAFMPLTRALTDDSGAVRAAAARGLAALKNAEAVPLLAEALSDTAPEHRPELITSLASFQDQQALPALHLIRETDAVNRVDAIQALIRLEGTPAMAPLTRPEDPLQADTVTAVRSLGMTALPHLLNLLQDDEYHAAVVTLITALGPQAVPVMADQLGQGDGSFRTRLVSCMATVGGKEADQALAAAFRSDDPDLRIAVMKGLTVIAHSKAAAVVRNGLNDPEQRVRLAALEAAGSLRDESLSACLFAFLDGSHGYLGEKAVDALAAIGGRKAAELLVHAVKSGTFTHRSHAARALRSLPVKNLPLFFTRFVEDQDHQLRKIALEAVGETDAPTVMPLLEKALTDARTDIRETAERILTQRRYQPSSPEIQAWLLAAQKNWTALEALGDAALPALMAALDSYPDFEPAARTLAHIGRHPQPDHPKAAAYYMETDQVPECIEAGAALAPQLAQYIEHAQGRRCINAAKAIAGLKHPDTYGALCRRLDSLQDDHQSTRPAPTTVAMELIKAIGDFQHPDTADFLGQLLLQIPYPRSMVKYRQEVLRNAVDVLAESGPSGIEQLVTVMISESAAAIDAERKLEQLYRDNGQETALALLPILQHRKIRARRYAAGKLTDLYGSGRLDERAMAAVSQEKKRMETAHTDQGMDRAHDDGVRRVEGWCMAHVDTPSSRHVDTGIGIPLPEIDPFQGRMQTQASSADIPEADLLTACDDIGNEAGRIRAVRMLGRRNSETARLKLHAALTDAAWPVRAAAALSIGENGQKDATEALWPLLDDPVWQVRQDARRAMEQLEGIAGNPAQQLRLWQVSLENVAPDVRLQTVRELAQSRWKEAVGPLRSALMDPEANVRTAAAEALKEIAGKIDIKSAAVSADDSPGQGNDLQALRHDLMKAMQDCHDRVRQAAARALISTGWQPVGNDPMVARYHLIQQNPAACVALGISAIAPLMETLNGRDNALKPNVITAMADIAAPQGAVDPSTLEKISESLQTLLAKNHPPEIRAAAVHALGRLPRRPEDTIFTDPIHDDPDAGVCQAAVQALHTPEDGRTWKMLLDAYRRCADLSASIQSMVDKGEFISERGNGRFPLSGLQQSALTQLGSCFGMERKRKAGDWRSALLKLQEAIKHQFRAKWPGNAEVLESVLSSFHYFYSPAAVHILSGMADIRAQKLLARALACDGLRDQAAAALKETAGPFAISACSRLLNFSEDLAVRQAAASVLKDLGWHPTQPDATVHWGIAAGDWRPCRELGDQAVPHLSAALLRPSGLSFQEKSSVATVLAGLSRPSAEQALRRGLGHSSFPVRAAVIQALPQLPPEKALEYLCDIIRNRRPDRRDDRADAFRALKVLHGRLPVHLRQALAQRARTDLKHTDVAAVYHQDQRTPQPGHSDYGGGKCIFPHHDVGSLHRDIPKVPHQDYGLSHNFLL